MNPVASDRPDPSRGLLLGVLTVGVLAVSSGAILVRLADAHPLVVAAYRVGLAFLLILPFSFRTCRRETREWDRRVWVHVLAAGVFLAVHFATWITSLSYTSVANSVVLVNTSPIWVGLLTPLVTRDRMSRRLWFGIALCTAGSLCIGWEGLRLGGGVLRGDALAVAGGIAAAGYLLMGRSVRNRVSTLSYITVCYGTAAVVLWILVGSRGLPISGFTADTWWALLALAVVSQHLGHSSYNWCLKHLSAAVLALTLLGEPILGSLWAFLLFGETLSAWQAAGGALILAGIYQAARPHPNAVVGDPPHPQTQ